MPHSSRRHVFIPVPTHALARKKQEPQPPGIKRGGRPLIFRRASEKPKETLVDPQKFQAVKQSLLKKLIPSSLIPLATANGMLVLGAHKSVGPGKDCSFPLPDYLIISGTISLAIVVIGVIGKLVVDWIMEDKLITRGERLIITFLEYLGGFLVFVEFCILVAGAVLIFPHLPSWQHDHRELHHYCDYGMILFASTFIALALFFVSIGTIFVVYLVCSAYFTKDDELGFDSSV